MKLPDLTGPGKPGIASTEWWGLAAVVGYAWSSCPPPEAPWQTWAGHACVTLTLATAATFYGYFRMRNKRTRLKLKPETKGREDNGR